MLSSSFLPSPPSLLPSPPPVRNSSLSHLTSTPPQLFSFTLPVSSSQTCSRSSLLTFVLPSLPSPYLSLSQAVWKWNQAAENDFASNPIDYDLEKKMADQWNRSNATNKRWRAAGTQEEKDLIAKEEAQRYIDISQGKITIPTYPRRPGDDKHWWSRS